MGCLASVLAGFSTGIGTLIVLRILQGLGGGVTNPIGFAIALRSAPRAQKGRMMSFLGLPVLAGPVLGPPLGGLLVDATTWRWLFWVNLVFGGMIVVLCRRFLPGSAPVRSSGQPDLLGAVLIVAGSALLVLACTQIGETGRVSPPAVVMLLGGLTGLAAFVLRSRRVGQPLIDFTVLHHPAVRWGLGTMAFFTAGYFGFAQILPAFVQGVRGDSVFAAGLFVIPVGLGVGITLQIATRLVDRVAPDRVIAVGVVTALTGLLAVAVAIATMAPAIVIAVLSVLVGIGSGATMMPTNVFITRDLTGAEVPAATTLLTLVSQLGTAIGTAAVASAITLTVGRHSATLAEVEPGGLAAMVRLDAAQRSALEDSMSVALGQSTFVPGVLVAAAVVVHLTGMLVRKHRGGASQ